MKVKLPNGSIVLAQHSGTVKLTPSLIITEVLFIPNFSVNLISVSQLCKSPKYAVQFTSSQSIIQDQLTKKMIGSAELLDGLYYISLAERNVNAYTASDTSQSNIPNKAIWHFRLGHISINRMLLLKTIFPFITVDNNGVCDVCHFSRHKKLPYNVSTNKAVAPFELIHLDIWGPIPTKSMHNHAFFLTAVDDYSRFTWIILMKHKSETRQHVIDFVKMIETQYKS
jgi:hypothetical protein